MIARRGESEEAGVGDALLVSRSRRSRDGKQICVAMGVVMS
jgi:hypothetical protein